MQRILLSTLVICSLLLPSLASADGLVFEGGKGPGAGKHIVFIAGDEEYRTEESCPMLAKILSKRYGFKTTVLFPINPDGGFIDPQYQKNIPGMEAVATADLVLIGTRFRDLPDEQLKPFADHLKAGKPVFGFRTATHAFKTKSKLGGINWSGFGPDILGEGWAGHYGKHMAQGARGVINPKHKGHAILNGVDTMFSESDVYGIKRVTEENAKILVHGVVTDTLYAESADTEGKVPQPGVWLKDYTVPDGKKGTALTSTFGSSCDLDDENLRRLFINAVFYLTGLEVPDKANVDYIDPFSPSAFLNHRTSDHYVKLNLKPSDYDWGKSPQTGPPLKTLMDRSPAPKKEEEKQAASSDEIIPTPAKVQQETGERPKFKQPKPLGADAAKPTTLPLAPEKGESIVFLGNSLAERMQHFGHFETLLYKSFPDKNITFRNMGFPGHTPSFRPEAGQPDPWAFPGGEKFRPEINGHNGKGHYPKPDEWLTILEAETIVAFFGFNESYDGLEGLDNFKAELTAFVEHTQKQGYNGKSAPKLVLVTPVAMEALEQYHLPDAAKRTALLKAYAEAVKDVAAAKQIGVADLFSFTEKRFSSDDKKDDLTINGVHLSDNGYKEIAPILFEQLFGTPKDTAQVDSELLRKAIYDKSWFWRNDFRMLNGVHVYGQRWNPYGNFNYPEEIEKIREMTFLRDENIWAIAQGKSDTLKVDDSKTRPLTPVTTNYAPSEKNGSPDYILEEEALKKFTLPEGYAVEVFATEQEFPNLGNPVQMQFDNKGRLWVSTVPSYPHYKPGGPMPADKLLIYEDTDGDGRADKETVFADDLHVPIGFEIAPEGVYISEEPFLTLHKDLDGDDVADTKEYVLDGFDPHDTHHGISAFDVDYGGGIFMCEGRFLHSQVETPWGPQRMSDGGAWRFDPKSWKVERVFQSDVSNPWGVVHDPYGQNFLNDASGGNQWWMLPLSMKVPHNHEIAKVEKFNYEHHIRPSSGSEFIYSRHFPDEVQGDYLYANSIGFLGIKQYKTIEVGTPIKGQYRQDLIQSTDGNFRPCDLEIAPDGTLYFLDWHNTLIGHMQHSARDPMRNNVYGRIYRIVAEGRDRVEPAKVHGADIATLFENMKLPELEARRRSHLELRGREASDVIAAAMQFAKDNADDERLVLEALWATWGHQQPSVDLIKKLLVAKDHRVRCGTVRVVRHCLHLLEMPEQYLAVAAKDENSRVRLEALSAATWLEGTEGAKILLTVASGENDVWLRTSLNSAILLLKDEVETLLSDGTFDKSAIPDADLLLAGKLPGIAKPKSVLTKGIKLSKEEKAVYELGARVYHRDGSCKTCHQETGAGLPNIYPPLDDTKWVLGDKERFIKLVLHGIYGKMEVKGKVYDPANGVPPMTAVGQMLTDSEVAAVITYVRKSFGNNADAVTPDEVKKVRAETKDRKIFYTPEELLKEHPFPESE